MTAWLALSLMPDDGWRRAALPLFEQGLVDALEWSFDAVWDRVPPPWLPPLVEHYAAADRLWAHGVSFSPGSVDGTTPGSRDSPPIERSPARAGSPSTSASWSRARTTPAHRCR